MRRIAIFARQPEPGRVKTRLSPALPPGDACALYRGMLADAIEAARGAHADQRVLYWDRPATGATAFDVAGFEPRLQRGADLGARLSAAFGELLRDVADRAVVIGADCPALDGAVIDAAFAALEHGPGVIGPAVDGGYVLIGLGRPAPALFEEIAWGTGRVAAQTLERARGAGLALARLDPLDDLDVPADLVRRLVREMEGVAPGTHTRAALRALGLVPGAGGAVSASRGAAGRTSPSSS